MINKKDYAHLKPAKEKTYKKGSFIYKDESMKTLIKCLDKNITIFKPEKSVEYIQMHAFDECDKLETLDFSDCKELELESESFLKCPVKKLILGPCVHLANFCIDFDNLEILETAYLGEYIEYLNFEEEDGRISICFPKLKEINVYEDDEEYYSINGVVYSKNTEQMIVYYPPGKTDKIYKIDERTTIGDAGTFIQNPYIEKIIFPANYYDFSQDIILGCKNLKEIESNNPDTIAVNDFFARKCKNLKTIIVHDKNSSIYLPNVNMVTFEDYILENASSFKKLNRIYKDMKNDNLDER